MTQRPYDEAALLTIGDGQGADVANVLRHVGQDCLGFGARDLGLVLSSSPPSARHSRLDIGSQLVNVHFANASSTI